MMIKIKQLYLILTYMAAATISLFAHQTESVSPVYLGQELPFRLKIQLVDFALPNGFQGGISACYKGKWLFMAGKTNDMDNFDANSNAFPVQKQNCMVYVVDPKRKKVMMRSLQEAASKLTQVQIDSLSVMSPQFYQKGKTLYMTGGYGIDTQSNTFTTKDVLSAIDIPSLMKWVEGKTKRAAQHCIRQISNPIFQVTGGYMNQLGSKPTLLVFGQAFAGTYLAPPYTQVYSQQVRRFRIYDNGKKLAVRVFASKSTGSNQQFHRKNLNVLPIIKNKQGRLVTQLLALSGAFTPEPDGGVWTVPIEITASGKNSMADQHQPDTFRQAMNNYASAKFSMFSKKNSDMYVLLLGGITFQYYKQGKLVSDSELPFTNQVTTIRVDREGHCKQFIMQDEYPVIRSTIAHPGNQLLFGTNAHFLPAEDVKMFPSGVIQFDSIKKRTVIGYIIGGIQSALMNTEKMTDSAASPYVFKVILEPK